MITATGVPSAAGTIARPRPGALTAKFAGLHDALGGREVGPDLATAPRVIAERDRVGAGRQQILGEARGDPDPVCGVLAVGDADVDLELAAERAQPPLDDVAAGSPDDVPDEENPHLYGRDAGAGCTSIATLSPLSLVCRASAWRSTWAMSATMPIFVLPASPSSPRRASDPARRA